MKVLDKNILSKMVHYERGESEKCPRMVNMVLGWLNPLHIISKTHWMHNRQLSGTL